jgi:hypothetical protein
VPLVVTILSWSFNRIGAIVNHFACRFEVLLTAGFSSFVEHLVGPFRSEVVAVGTIDMHSSSLV